ncbi:MAG TPA: hypothetical protein VGE59_03985 [Patescibacteria group bacterium]
MNEKEKELRVRRLKTMLLFEQAKFSLLAGLVLTGLLYGLGGQTIPEIPALVGKFCYCSILAFVLMNVRMPLRRRPSHQESHQPKDRFGTDDLDRDPGGLLGHWGSESDLDTDQDDDL